MIALLCVGVAAVIFIAGCCLGYVLGDADGVDRTVWYYEWKRRREIEARLRGGVA